MIKSSFCWLLFLIEKKKKSCWLYVHKGKVGERKDNGKFCRFSVCLALCKFMLSHSIFTASHSLERRLFVFFRNQMKCGKLKLCENEVLEMNFFSRKRKVFFYFGSCILSQYTIRLHNQHTASHQW